MSGNPDGEPNRSWPRWVLAGGVAVAALVIAAGVWRGCRQYPAVTSKESLALMKLLYSACNTKDERRLAEVEKGVERLTREGKMTPAERAGFDGIVGTARGGDWKGAEDAAFKFAQDQVGVGHPDPHRHGGTKDKPPLR